MFLIILLILKIVAFSLEVGGGVEGCALNSASFLCCYKYEGPISPIGYIRENVTYLEELNIDFRR